MTTFLKRINLSILHSYGIEAAGECHYGHPNACNYSVLLIGVRF